MDRLLTWITAVFDPLHHFWEGERTQRAVAGFLVAVFIVSLGVIECKRRGWLPESLSRDIPVSHFAAVSLAFTLLLILEVIGLIMTLPCSVSRSVGKQLEILALILMRNAFKELIAFPEPVDLSQGLGPLLPIVTLGCGALGIFAVLGLYYRVAARSPRILKDGVQRFRFVATKKGVALVMLAGFVVAGVIHLRHWDHGPLGHEFFTAFYTALIFADILIVLVSQRHLPVFHAVFRNSGYALATVFMRLSLTAPVHWEAALGVFSALFALAVGSLHMSLSPVFGGAMSETPDPHSKDDDK